MICSGMMSRGGQSSGGCKLSKAHGSALPHGILGSLCLRYLGNSQVECEVAHTVLKQSPTLGRAQPREWRGQDNRTLTLGPSQWDLATSSTSQKRPSQKRGKAGVGDGEVGPPTQARPKQLITDPVFWEGHLPGAHRTPGVSQW